jgi:hypothetical protein
MSQMDSNAQDSNFPDRGPAVFAVTTATLALATLFVAARMVSRAGIVRRTGADDYTMVLAWLIALFMSLSINLGARRGLGRHDKDIDPASHASLRMCEYVFSILYVRITRPLRGRTFLLHRNSFRRSWRPRHRSSFFI